VRRNVTYFKSGLENVGKFFAESIPEATLCQENIFGATCCNRRFQLKRLCLPMKTRSTQPGNQFGPLRGRLSSARLSDHKTRQTPIYSFAAIVGQEEMKLALVLNVIDPLIGGVLIMGHRGTGKSTAVRALADLLPEISAVLGCPYQCDPADESNLCFECTSKRMSSEKLGRTRLPVKIVDLPLGATEDRICGTIDIERALKGGVKSFEPGLLARANRGFLYIDEVNLLEDHLVDLLLDVATTGRNKVERENISIEHPARFVLIGSGNPEEGELRPQLIDRFGLHVEVKTEDDPDRRMEIVERRQSFENHGQAFSARFAKDQRKLRDEIVRAQETVGAVHIDRTLLRQIAQLCSELRIDGHRGELTIARAARALAAFEGRRKINSEDIRSVAVMSLRHRLRRDPLDEIAGTDKIQRALDKLFPESVSRSGEGSSGSSAGGPGNRGGNSTAERSISANDDVAPVIVGNESPSRGRGSRSSSTKAKSTAARNHIGANRTQLNYERGRYTIAVSHKRSGARVAIDATLRALAGIGYRVSGAGKEKSLPAPGTRHPTPTLAPDTRHLTPCLRYKQLARKTGTVFIMAIDTSGSMARNRISQAKGAALKLLRQSYIKRDRVAIVGFRGTRAEVLLPPSKSMLRASRVLDSLAVGGGTPLSAGLRCSLEVAKRVKSEGAEIVLLLFTDARANVAVSTNGNGSRMQRQAIIEREIAGLGLELRRVGVRTIVVDTQNEFIASHNARLLAEQLGGTYQRLRNTSES
jgi:magnesium chelatase subunit D